ncbi:MAG: hypothetical protein DRJ42_19370, partial [Deltaproteobacteria bacterium]
MNVWEEFQERYPAARAPWTGEKPLREAFPGATDELVAVLATLGTGALGLAAHRLFNLDEAKARHASALAQLARERDEVVEFDAAQCSGQGHDSAQDCLDALAGLRPAAAGLYPPRAPADAYDLVY